MSATEIPLDPALRWEWIKYQLRTRGGSLAKLARSLGVSGPAVKNTKHWPYPRMERAIAQALDLKPVELWPERWNADGTPCRRRGRRAEHNATSGVNHTPAYDLGHRKTGTRG